MRLISPEQAHDHPARYALTRSLGGELIVRTDVRKEDLVDGDTFLVCSDGLWGKLDIAEIRSALAGEVETAIATLVDLAIERGGEDNATGLLLRVEHAGESEARPAGWRRFFAGGGAAVPGR
jgi:serine/threonine protein phosphatase PrpC